MRPLVAVTGATGFLGRHLLIALSSRGLRLRMLARRDPASVIEPGLRPEVIAGDLEDTSALARLLRGADIVIHAAGLTRALVRRDFLAVNRDGAARLAEAARRETPEAHLIGISSLAARAPHVSAYAGSKQAGEVVLAAFAGRLTILRPPVLYGPWDRGTLGIFRAAARAIVPVPGPASARIAMMHVADAAASVAAVADGSETGGIHALADTNPLGYAPSEIIRVAAEAMSHRPHLVRLPATAVRLAGRAASALAWMRGAPGNFSAGKAGEMVYGRWGVTQAELLPASIFSPGTDLQHGFAATVAWYRQAGWLEER